MGSISTKSTLAPQYQVQLVDATNEIGEVHKISPCPKPSDKHAICRADVALVTATAYLALV